MGLVPSNRFRHRLLVGCAVALVIGGSFAARAATARSDRDGETREPLPTTSRPSDQLDLQAPQEQEASRQRAEEQLSSGLIGSKHDFSQGGKSGRDLCLPCHTPHLAVSPPPRLDRRTATPPPLRPYEGIGIELSGWSLLCLGCHDGVTATDVYSSAHAVAVTGQLANSRLGVAGLRSHPVGVSYPTVSETYEPIAAVEAAGLMLPGGRIQCTSCHDAHNTHRHRGMLRTSNERSRLCLTCHRI
jgi:predicted CXXCH cytochrome family protein